MHGQQNIKMYCVGSVWYSDAHESGVLKSWWNGVVT